MLPQTLTKNNSTPAGSHKTQQDIRPRWGRLITTTLEQEYAIPMESDHSAFCWLNAPFDTSFGLLRVREIQKTYLYPYSKREVRTNAK